MIRNQLKAQSFVNVSEALELTSVYRPLDWRADYVLSDKRKAVLKQRYINAALSVLSILMVLGVIAFLGTITPTISSRTIPVSKSAVHAGNEAYARGHYLDARKYYKEAIQAGQGSQKVWMQYDRALLMNTMQQLKSDPSVLDPARSNRNEIQPVQAPATLESEDNYLSEEEWRQMRRKAYEWLGC